MCVVTVWIPVKRKSPAHPISSPSPALLCPAAKSLPLICMRWRDGGEPSSDGAFLSRISLPSGYITPLLINLAALRMHSGVMRLSAPRSSSSPHLPQLLIRKSLSWAALSLLRSRFRCIILLVSSRLYAFAGQRRLRPDPTQALDGEQGLLDRNDFPPLVNEGAAHRPQEPDVEHVAIPQAPDTVGPT